MDSLTHTVLGACLGDLVGGRKLGKKAMLLGAIINNIPDIDVVSYLWLDPTEALLAHRGITHSIIFNGVLTFVLANAFVWIFKKWHFSLLNWVLLLGVNLFSHIFMDTFTSYGTGLLEPFDGGRFSLNALFIMDPFFTLPLLVASVILLFVNTRTRKSKVWPKTGIILSLLYLALCGVNKIYIARQVDREIASKGISVYDRFITPTPLNNLLWYIVIREEGTDDLYTGYASVQDKNPPVFKKVPRNDSLLAPFKGLKSVQELVRFSKGYYCMQKRDGMIVFNDMRFGQESGWLGSDDYVFNFSLGEEKPGMLQVQKGRFRTFRKEALFELWDRILGDQK